MNPVSLIFTTYNRNELLHQALKAAQQQSVPVNIIVMDDASTDGTQEMMKNHFPTITYCRSGRNLGPAFQRNEGAKLAESDILFFLDDDTVIKNENIIEDILKDFTNPTIASVTIPFINILQDNTINTGSPDNKVEYIYHSFVAAAFAVRRQIFIKLNGFRSEYFYMGEEGDFCLRLLQAGYFVKAGTSEPALHYQPANRISFTADFYGRRNDILFLYLNAPAIKMPLSITYTILRGLLYGARVGRMKFAYKGLSAGLRLLFNKEIRYLRKPVDGTVFIRFRHLKRYEPVPLSLFLKL
jgi:GT2 family glycosyltransferase